MPRQSGHGAAPKSYAYVFILYGSKCEPYFLGAVMAAYSLMKHLSVHQRVLLYTPDVPQSVLDLARALDVFDEITVTEYIEASEVFFSNPRAHARFGSIFTKYRVFGLEQYDKVLLLDTDLYVRANIDSLFNMQAPAGMARGKVKYPEGEAMPKGTPVNAGVMLLKPDAKVLAKLVEELGASRPRRPQNLNSPDADFLTEFIYPGQWASIPLQFNFQLEYEALDTSQGTIRFSQAREAHFSEASAAMPWAALKVAHFSGAKPWAHLLDDASALQRLRASGGGGLGEKLAEGLREYAQEASALQGLLSQLQLGEGVLWRETRCEQAAIAAPPEAVRARLHALLPHGGRWFEGPRPRAAVWIPPGASAVLDAPHARPSPVAAYLEVLEKAVVKTGCKVRVQATGSGGQPYTVYAIAPNGQTAVLRRKMPLPPHWQVARDNESGSLYYHNARTCQVQWEYPELPEHWQAITDDETGHVYYHNTHTNETLWDPDFEKLECPVSELEVEALQGSTSGGATAGGAAAGGADAKRGESVVTIWRRSFLEDPEQLRPMRKALSALAGEM